MSDSPPLQKDDRPPISAEFLARYRDRPEFLRHLFTAFLSDEEQLLIGLHAAFVHEDRELLRFSAHTLKGASASLGLARLEDAARALEYAARDGHGEQLSGGLAAVDEEIENVFQVMRTYLR